MAVLAQPPAFFVSGGLNLHARHRIGGGAIRVSLLDQARRRGRRDGPPGGRAAPVSAPLPPADAPSERRAVRAPGGCADGTGVPRSRATGERRPGAESGASSPEGVPCGFGTGAEDPGEGTADRGQCALLREVLPLRLRSRLTRRLRRRRLVALLVAHCSSKSSVRCPPVPVAGRVVVTVKDRGASPASPSVPLRGSSGAGQDQARKEPLPYQQGPP